MTYKLMHLIERYDDLIIAHFVHDSINASSFATGVMSVALVETYYVAWAESAQLLLYFFCIFILIFGKRNYLVSKSIRLWDDFWSNLVMTYIL